jgi:replicative DNA helicase
MYNIVEIIKKYKQMGERGELVIPFLSFNRLNTYLPGIEKGTYYLITASSGVGKSRFARRVFLHDVIEYYLANKNKIKLKIFYFALEESKERIWMSIISNLLYKKHNVQQSIRDLSSKFEPLSNEIIKQIEELEPTLKEISEIIEIYDDIRSSVKITNIVLKHLKNNGKEEIKEKEGIEYIDSYTSNTENEFTIVITDHIGLLDYKTSIKSDIEKWSGTNCIKLRDKYGVTIVNIQQQAATGESIDNIKAFKLEPSYTNLAESKLTFRDANVVLGLFSPHKHEIASYKGFDINILKDNYRSLTIMKDRDGESNYNLPLYFNGKIEMFKELPKKTEIDKIRNIYENIKNNNV